MFEMLGRDAKRDGSQEDLQGLPVDLQFPQCCLDLAVERERAPHCRMVHVADAALAMSGVQPIASVVKGNSTSDIERKALFCWNSQRAAHPAAARKTTA